MKRFIFYVLASIAFILGVFVCLVNIYHWNYYMLKTAITTELKYQIMAWFALYYVIALFTNVIICSVRMSKKCAFSFYGRPIEFHGDTINTYDYGRITFRTKNGDLEAYNIYTTKSLDLPQYQCMFNVGISKNGTVKTMYEVDEMKDRVSKDYVRGHNYITSILMIFLISILPIFGILTVLIKTRNIK